MACSSQRPLAARGLPWFISATLHVGFSWFIYAPQRVGADPCVCPSSTQPRGRSGWADTGVCPYNRRANARERRMRVCAGGWPAKRLVYLDPQNRKFWGKSRISWALRNADGMIGLRGADWAGFAAGAPHGHRRSGACARRINLGKTVRFWHAYVRVLRCNRLVQAVFTHLNGP